MEFLGTDAIPVIVESGSIVKDFDVVEDVVHPIGSPSPFLYELRFIGGTAKHLNLNNNKKFNNLWTKKSPPKRAFLILVANQGFEPRTCGL